MNYIDYPVFQQFLGEYEGHEKFLFQKLKKNVEKEEKRFHMNVTEFEFNYKTRTLKIYNVLMAENENDPKSCCKLPIDDFFDILIQRKIAQKNPKEHKNR